MQPRIALIRSHKKKEWNLFSAGRAGGSRFQRSDRAERFSLFSSMVDVSSNRPSPGSGEENDTLIVLEPLRWDS